MEQLHAPGCGLLGSGDKDSCMVLRTQTISNSKGKRKIVQDSGQLEKAVVTKVTIVLAIYRSLYSTFCCVCCSLFCNSINENDEHHRDEGVFDGGGYSG